MEDHHEVGGLPPGVINLVNGSADVVNAMLDSPDIDAISFVGSAKTAKYIYQRAAANGKRVQALGGAKNYMVVMPDAVMDKTADNIIGSAFGAAGQRCMAGSVIVTVGDAKKPLFDALLPKVEALTSATAWRRAPRRPARLDHGARPHPRLDRQGRRGGRDARGRRPPAGGANGAFVGPTIIDGVTPDMEVAQEEIFGPVLSVIHADSLDHAIEIVNGTRYGNGTSIFTESGAAVRRYRADVAGRHDRRQRRRRRAGRVLPVLRLEGLVLRRHARAGGRRGRLLHAQEDGHDALVLGRPDRQVLRRAGRPH